MKKEIERFIRVPSSEVKTRERLLEIVHHLKKQTSEPFALISHNDTILLISLINVVLRWDYDIKKTD